MRTKVFRVSGMSCPNCALRIEGMEDELEGVIAVRASYPKSLVEIEFDETRIDSSRIKEAVLRIGYSLTEV